MRKCPRIIPHLASLVAHANPDPSRTTHVRTVLAALAKGDKALEAVANVTPERDKKISARTAQRS